MKYMQFLLFLSLVASINYSQASSFGYSGQDGSNGYSGTDGIDARNVTVTAGTAYEFVLNGTNGSAGGNGSSGSSASSCFQDTGHSDEYGADGGDGGSGGHGGRGGDGGSVSIFYKDINTLKQITIENQGGFGAEGGYGAESGYGCSCSTSSWSHRTCSDVQRCSTSQNCSSERICEETGETRTEGGVTAPVRSCFDRRSCSPVESCHTENVCTSNSYSCSSGSSGSTGSRGGFGRDGYWGSIKLIKDIVKVPAQSPTSTITLVDIVESPVKLTKQIWETKTNGKELFSKKSLISGSYIEFIKLAKRDFKVIWNASRSIESLGAVSLNISFDGEKISHSLKGDILLDSSITEEEGATVLVINNAYRADELKELEIASTKGHGKRLVITIRDKASLSMVVKTEVSLQFVWRRTIGGWHVTYDQKVPADKMNIFADRIEINVGELGINPKHIKRKRRVRYTLKMKRSFGDSSTNAKLFQDKIKLY